MKEFKWKLNIINDGYFQIENEYGSYFACDSSYTLALRDQVNRVLDSNVQIYTTDGGADYFLKCGAVNGTYPTIDFGITSKSLFRFTCYVIYDTYAFFFIVQEEFVVELS